MIDIKGELLRLENQRKQEYISIIELLDCIKAYNQTVSFQEIATYLLIKLTPNDIRKTDDQIWGQEDYEEWVRDNGIEVFYIPESLDCLPENRFSDLFFEALETVKNYSDPPAYIFDDVEDKAEHYLQEDQKTLFVKRERIENLLGIKTITPQKQKALEDELAQKQFTAVAMALTKTDEFVKNTDINKSPTGLAERSVYEERLAEKDKRIAELENQLKNQSAVNSEQVLESPKATRTSQAQRDIFSLLVVQNYPNCVTRNSLLESINADLRRIGINTKGISYPTLNNLIDEDLRIKVTTQDGKTIEKSPFPDKAKK